ncbi:helix-turn-helix domain-containing protein [Desulfobacula phenolica]|nr:AraC family transcriptional regulator [Desulfobacula phenolica]
MIRQINIRKQGSDSTKPNHFEKIDITHSDSNGESFFENISLRPGLRLIISKREISRNFRMIYEIGNAPVSFCYNLSFRNRCTITEGDKKGMVMERVPGDSVLAYLPETKGIIETLPGKQKLGISIHFSVQSFRDLFMQLPQCLTPILTDLNTTQSFYQQSAFNKETALVLQQIIACPYQGEIQRLFFESKALELVALKLMEMGEYQDNYPSNLSRPDSEQIREAYHILTSRIESPPSLNDLSRQVGINRNKLNQGFKLIYGDTVFNTLRNIRLNRARTLLLNTELSLSEIAFSVGYNNQANFTTAFRRQCGKTPKSVRLESIAHL